MTQRIAIYPTSANPPTLGHADTLVRTARYFDYVYWAAAINPEKTYSFTEEQRPLFFSERIGFFGIDCCRPINIIKIPCCTDKGVRMSEGRWVGTCGIDGNSLCHVFLIKVVFKGM